MEAQEEVMMGSRDQTHIVKGKRTKRQRPQSPVPFAMITTTSGEDIIGGGGGSGGDCYNVDILNTNNIMNWSPPATTSTELQDSTEEEEDMANCLILLAKGQSVRSSGESLKQVEEDVATAAVASAYKLNSRRFLEVAGAGIGPGTGTSMGTSTGTVTDTSNKAGCYIYECKTCNRTFQSFQALGGHRASHKKTKALAAAAEEKKQFLLSSEDDSIEEAQHQQQQVIVKKNNNDHFSSSLSLQLSNSSRGLYSNNNNINRSNNTNNNNKVHECSVCGAEFTSGQALGGHMRRHRSPMGTSSSTSLSLTAPIALESDQYHQDQPPNKKPTHMLSLDLDLNLPAPEDDHDHVHGVEQKFPFAPKQQQQQQQQQQQSTSLVFSAPTLVDCHY